MKPTEILIAEHDSILEMLRVLGVVCDRLDGNEAVAPENLNQILSFLKGFADRCHHGKEEDLLFPAMEEAGIPREAGPIGVMLTEHVQGRDYIQRMTAAVRLLEENHSDGSTRFVEAGRAYVDLLNQHIQKENNVLFRMADAHVSEIKQRQLEEQFEKVNREDIGSDVIEGYRQQLEELKNVYL